MTSTPCTHIQPATNPVIVNLPDGSTMKSTHICLITLPGLPQAAHRAHLFPALADHAFISVGQLCDHGCNINYTATDVTITLHDHTLFTGVRTDNGLWTVTLTPSTQWANAATTISPLPAALPN